MLDSKGNIKDSYACHERIVPCIAQQQKRYVMIERASLTVASDGGVLITLPMTGMDLKGSTEFSVEKGLLRIGQGGRWFVEVPISVEQAARLLHTEDVTVVEADELGFDFHERVRRV